MNTLYQNVSRLMNATSFGVGIYREELGVIEVDYGVENGKRIAPYVRRMDQPNQLSVWCVRHRQEILINDLRRDFVTYAESYEKAEEMVQAAFQDGRIAVTPMSMIYVPLLLKGRVLGCIVVQSRERNAYQTVHLDMLRTLAAYAAVAFDNADAYAQLQAAQEQLVQQKMMASLGRLVAGVAHETNTPIGNIRTVASLLQKTVNEHATRFGEGGMPQAELQHFLDFLREASEVIERGSMRAIELIARFKQLAMEPAGASRRRFDATALLELTLRTLAPKLQERRIEVVLETQPGLALTGEAERFEQLIANLVENAMLHGFEGRDRGRLHIQLQRLSVSAVQLTVSDNGVGMEAALLEKIFEPYFTTKFGQGGSGLGLYMVHNIVTHVFRGRISVTSAPGSGSTFTIELPDPEAVHPGPVV
jgi:signal transduction histidine kinase